MNLIQDPWIPVDRQSGPNQRIAPWEITDSDDPILRLAAPRPDFNGALLQFLIGLLQTACAPEDEDQWVDWLENPPTPQDLRQAFGRLSSAFDLDGRNPRFMQDHTLLEEDKISELPISNLLMDSNETHFNKPGAISCACSSCTAMALFTLQTNSPEGGRGHYTSLRGGGPLTTIVVLEEEERSPWRDVWVNVLNTSQFSSLNPSSDSTDAFMQFPWLSPESFVKANTKRDVYPPDIGAEQVFWIMPRRIYLSEAASIEVCDLCGSPINSGYSHYLNRPAGISYSNEPVWRHPLSPRYPTDKKGLKKAFRHPRAGGITYDLWPSLVLDSYANNETAEVVRVFQNQRQKIDQYEQIRLLTFGYHTKKNKALCWYEATYPMYRLNDKIKKRFSDRVHSLISAATGTAKESEKYIKEAWFKRPGDVRGDTTFLIEAFFNHTENAFFTQLEKLIKELESGEDGRVGLYAWHKTLGAAALELFDFWTDRGDFETVNPRRIAEARRKLSRWLFGKSIGLPTLLGINHKEKAA